MTFGLYAGTLQCAALNQRELQTISREVDIIVVCNYRKDKKI